MSGALAQVPAHATMLNPSTAQWPPTFVQHDDIVHAFAIGTTTLWHARSIDGGRNWPLREQALGTFATNTSAATNDFTVHAVAGPGELLVLGHDVNLGPQVVRSFDDGLTWTMPVRVTTTVVPQTAVMQPGLHKDGMNVVVAWTNARPTGRVFCNRSTDGGATWPANDTPLDVGFVPAWPAVNRLLMLGSGPIVHVLWHDGAMRRQRSLDGGATWLPAVGTLAGVPALLTQLPVKFAGNGVVLLLQLGSEVVRSVDAGDSWTVVGNHGVQQVLDVAMQGNLAVVVGRDTVTSTPTFFVNVSTDGGATWGQQPLQLPGAFSVGVFAHAYVDGGAVFVNWEVVGFAGNVIRSTDAGATWHVIDGPVQAGFSPGRERTVHTARTYIGAGAYRYHAYVGVGSTLLGAPTAGSGGIAPSLATDDLPVRGGSTTLQGQGAVGGSVAALGVSLLAPTAIPFGSATIHLASLDLLVAVPTSGANGQAGAGSFALPLAIPNTASLVGTSLVAQALILDSGVVDGFAVTNALEIWLR